jgi:hypothetical protein
MIMPGSNDVERPPFSGLQSVGTTGEVGTLCGVRFLPLGSDPIEGSPLLFGTGASGGSGFTFTSTGMIGFGALLELAGTLMATVVLVLPVPLAVVVVFVVAGIDAVDLLVDDAEDPDVLVDVLVLVLVVDFAVVAMVDAVVRVGVVAAVVLVVVDDFVVGTVDVSVVEADDFDELVAVTVEVEGSVALVVETVADVGVVPDDVVDWVEDVGEDWRICGANPTEVTVNGFASDATDDDVAVAESVAETEVGVESEGVESEGVESEGVGSEVEVRMSPTAAAANAGCPDRKAGIIAGCACAGAFTADFWTLTAAPWSEPAG